MADGELIININANTANIESGLSRVNQDIKGLGDSARTAGGGFADFAKNAMAFAVGGVIQQGFNALAGSVTGFFKNGIEQSNQWTQAMNQVGAVLKSTGGAAGVTAQQVSDLASKLSASGGLSRAADDSIASMEAMVLTFTNIHSNVFPQTTQAILDMATAMNNGAAPSTEQLTKNAILVGKALNDPIKGLTALQRVGVTFSESQKEVIASMIKTGDVAGAQQIILAELNKEFGGSAVASTKSFAGQMDVLRETFNNVAQTMGDALVPALTGLIAIFTSPDVVNGIQSFVTGLAQGLTTAINTAVALFQEFGPKVITVFQQIYANVAPIIGNIVDWFMRMIPQAVAIAGQVFNGILVPVFNTVANIAVNYLLPAMQRVGDFLAANLPPIIEGISNLWQTVLGPALTFVADVILNYTLPALMAIAQFIIDNWQVAVIALGAVIGAVAIPAIIAFVAALSPIEIVIGAVILAVTLLKAAWDNNFLGMRDIITAVGNAIGSVLGWIGDRIRDFLNWLGINMPKSGGDAGSGFINNMNNGIANGVPTLNTNINGISGNLAALQDPAAAYGAHIGNNWIKGVCDNVAQGIPVLNSQIQAIKTALATMSTIAAGASGNVPMTIEQQVHAKELGLNPGGAIAPGRTPADLESQLSIALTNAQNQLRQLQNAAGGTLPSGEQVVGPGLSLFGGASLPGLGAGGPASYSTGGGGAGGKGGGGGGKGAVENAIQAAADMTQKISQAVTAGITALSQLSNFTLPQGFESGMDQFAAAINVVMMQMQAIAVQFKAEMLTQTSAFLDAAIKAVQLISQGVDAFKKLQDFKAPSVDAMMAFAAALDQMMMLMGQIASKWSTDAIALMSVFADSAGKMIQVVSSGVDALQKLKGFQAPSADAMTAFANALDYVLDAMRRVIAKWDTGALQAAAQFGDSMGKFIGVISAGADAMAKLANFKKPMDDQMTGFVDALDYITDLLRRVVAKWSAEALTQAAAFGDGVGKLVAGLGAGVDMLGKLIGFRKPTDDAMNAFRDALDYMIDLMRSVIAKWSVDALTAAGQFGESIGKLLQGLGQGLALLQGIGSKTFVEPSRAAVDAFFTALNNILNDFQSRAAQWQSYGQAAVTAIGQGIGQVIDGISKGVGLLTSLADPAFKTPTQAAVDAFFAGMTQILDAFAARAAAFASDANTLTASIATAVGTIMDGVGKGIAPLEGLVDFKVPASTSIDAFFGALTGFLQAFASRADSWKASATDEVTKIAQNVGTIAEALGKVVDPLLKVLGFKGPDGATPNPSVTLMGHTFTVKAAGATGMSAFFDALTAFINEFASRSSQWVAANDKTVQSIATGIGTVMDGVGKAIDPIAKLQNFKAPGMSSIDSFFSAMQAFINKLGALIASIPATFVANAVAFAAGINQMFGDLSNAMTTAAGIKTPADLPDIFKNILSAIQDVVTYMQNTAVSAWSTALDKMVSDAQAAAAAITQAFQGIQYPAGVGGGTTGAGGSTTTGGSNTTVGTPGGGGMEANALAFGGGGGFGSVGGVTLNLYLDGIQVSPQQLSQRLGLRARLTGARP